jgi:hypothetical protein
MLAWALTPAARADLVYDNSTTDLNTRFNPGLFEVGDEIILAPGTPRHVTNFIFQYYGVNLSGTENVQIRFYANDGPASYSGPFEPGTLLYDSGLFNFGAYGSTDRNTIAYGGIDVFVPDSFTWTVQFSSLGVGAVAGVDLYSPPTVGQNYPDYWENDGSGWMLKTNAVVAMDFGARVEAMVPEPSVAALSLLGGALAIFLGARRRRS